MLRNCGSLPSKLTTWGLGDRHFHHVFAVVYLTPPGSQVSLAWRGYPNLWLVRQDNKVSISKDLWYLKLEKFGNVWDILIPIPHTLRTSWNHIVQECSCSMEGVGMAKLSYNGESSTGELDLFSASNWVLYIGASLFKPWELVCAELPRLPTLVLRCRRSECTRMTKTWFYFRFGEASTGQCTTLPHICPTRRTGGDSGNQHRRLECRQFKGLTLWVAFGWYPAGLFYDNAMCRRCLAKNKQCQGIWSGPKSWTSPFGHTMPLRRSVSIQELVKAKSVGSIVFSHIHIHLNHL